MEANIPEQTPKNNFFTAKRIIILAVLALIAFGVYYAANVMLSHNNYIRQIYLVPRNAVLIVKSRHPVDDWKTLSNSNLWQFLKTNKLLGEFTEKTNKIDSIIKANGTVLSLVGSRDLMISVHKINARDFDFLYLVDLGKISKINVVKDQIDNIATLFDYNVTERKYKQFTIFELLDPKTRQTLYVSAIDNHLACSYVTQLLEASIDERENPTIGRDINFIEVSRELSNNGIFTVYLNYAYLYDYLKLFFAPDLSIAKMCATTFFSGMDLNFNGNEININTITKIDDTKDSYLLAFQQSGKNKITAHEVLPSRTCVYANIGVANVSEFLNNLEKILRHDGASYKSFTQNFEIIENFLKIDIRKNLLSWMSGEIAFAQLQPSILTQQSEYAVVIRADNIDKAREQLEFVEKQVKKRTPVKFNQIEYNGYTIKYLEIKGFFKLIFGRMFARIEKPYYTIIGNYVIMSNKTETLLTIIEDYTQKQTLANNEKFVNFMRKFNSSSTLFFYTDMPKYFTLFKDILNAQTWNDLQQNKKYITCFSQTGFQAASKDDMLVAKIISEFEEQKETEPDETPETDAEEEKELTNLQIFYAEKLQKNVHREFYDTGEKKSEVETDDGMRDGKYREYYQSGKLKTVGKYKRNKRNKKWYYYNEDGTLLRKEKYKNGTLDEQIILDEN